MAGKLQHSAASENPGKKLPEEKRSVSNQHGNKCYPREKNRNSTMRKSKKPNCIIAPEAQPRRGTEDISGISPQVGPPRDKSHAGNSQKDRRKNKTGVHKTERNLGKDLYQRTAKIRVSAPRWKNDPARTQIREQKSTLRKQPMGKIKGGQPVKTRREIRLALNCDHRS